MSFLDSVARLITEPTANLTATAIAFAIVILVILIIIIALLFFALGPPKRGKIRPIEHERSEKTPRAKRDPRVWILLWVGGGLLILIAIFASTSTNQYCADVCHSMSPSADAWEASSHSGVSCVRCHEETPGTGALTSISTRARDIVAAILPNATAQHPRVPADACLACHDNLSDEVITADNGVRVAHEHFIAEGAPCETCHGNVAHVGEEFNTTQSSTMSACLRCHDDVTASADCEICHTGDPGKSPIIDRRPVQVSMPSITCGGCHQQETCDDCHGVRMPHSDDYADPKLHARAGAFASGKELCYGCHTPNDCTSCHLPFDAHGADWFAQHTTYSFADGDGYCLWCHKTQDYCRICH